MGRSPARGGCLEQRAHAVANGYFVGTINRVGTEAPWNIGEFFGSSYFCNPDGRILAKGSEDWRIAPELTPGDGEPLIDKNYGDSFEDTPLETVLSGLGVGRLIVVGAETDACIRSTIHGAFVRGYDATLVSDAHTTGDQTEWGAPPPDQVIAHTNLYWKYQTAPGRKAGTVETKNVDFAGKS